MEDLSRDYFNIVTYLNYRGKAFLNLIGVIEEEVPKPPEYSRVDIPEDCSFVLIRMAGVRDSKASYYDLQQVPLAPVSGTILTLLTKSDIQKYRGQWVTIKGGSLRYLRRTYQELWGFSSVAFRKTNGAWSLSPSRVEPGVTMPEAGDGSGNPAMPVQSITFDASAKSGGPIITGRSPIRGRSRGIPYETVDQIPQSPPISLTVLPNPNGNVSSEPTFGQELNTLPMVSKHAFDTFSEVKTIHHPYPYVVNDDLYTDTVAGVRGNIEQYSQDFIDFFSFEVDENLATERADILFNLFASLKNFNNSRYEGLNSSLVSSLDDLIDSEEALKTLKGAPNAAAHLYNVYQGELSKMDIVFAACAFALDRRNLLGKDIKEFKVFLQDPFRQQILYKTSSLGLALSMDSLLNYAGVEYEPRQVDIKALTTLYAYDKYDDKGTIISYDDMARSHVEKRFQKPFGEFLQSLGLTYRPVTIGSEQDFVDQNIPGFLYADYNEVPHLAPLSVVDLELNLFQRMVDASYNSTDVTEEIFNRKLSDYQDKVGFELSKEQVDGVSLVYNQVGVLSGSAGSGKTTTSECMTDILEEAGYEVMFATPTGKASKRLSEVVNRPVRTLHSTFRIPVGSPVPFLPPDSWTYDYELELPRKVAFIFDEMAMADSRVLAISVLEVLSINPNACIYFLGDIKQLPPISKGMPFRDLMQLIPTVELGVSKRAAEGSLINYNCNVLNNGSPASNGDMYPFKAGEDFFLHDCPADIMHHEILKACEFFLGQGWDRSDIQVVSPYARISSKRKHTTEELNPPIQKIMNGKSPVLFEHGKNRYRLGDKIIHNVNQSEWMRYEYIDGRFRAAINPETGEDLLGIVNGEVGELAGIFDSNSPEVASFGLEDNQAVAMLKVADQDSSTGLAYIPYLGTLEERGGAVRFNSDEFSMVALAYAISVHKSQGSQYKVIIFPIAEGDRAEFVNRNMIYTAISRAQKVVAMIGSVGPGGGLTSNRRVVQDGSDVNTLLGLFRDSVNTND